MKWGVHSGYSYSWFHPSFTEKFSTEKMKMRNGYFAGLIYRTPRSDYFSTSFELNYERKGVDSILFISEKFLKNGLFYFDYLGFSVSANIRFFEGVEFLFSPGLCFSYLTSAEANGTVTELYKTPYQIKKLQTNYSDFVHPFDINVFGSIEYHYFLKNKVGFFGEFRINYGMLPIMRDEFAVKNISFLVLAGLSLKH